MYELWIYSARQAKWIEMFNFADDELDKILRFAQEIEAVTPWAVISDDGLQYWKKGESPEAILRGIEIDAHRRIVPGGHDA